MVKLDRIAGGQGLVEPSGTAPESGPSARRT
jgi:hypothetical protein